MTDIYLFLGPHLDKPDFERLKSNVGQLSKELSKKEKLISIIEYGGPPYLPSWTISEDVVSSDEKFKEYFDEQRTLINEDIIFFIKNRKSQPNITTSPFHELNLNLLLDLGAELVLENVPFDEYKKFVRDCHKFLRINMPKMIMENIRNGNFSEPHLDNEKFQKPMNDMRDRFIVRQIRLLSNQNPKASFMIVRGNWHKDLVDLLKKENFNVIDVFY
ncbi:hypothetical protein CEE44_01735 [Candidatus Woesearchaeota archaeon B3_Woes]|nr:MAG: hypothetical protein CEE44_01735 [Candidatus Woesearchaeota archaeon B3_Woes]